MSCPCSTSDNESSMDPESHTWSGAASAGGSVQVCEVRWRAIGGRPRGLGGRVRQVGDGRADGPGRGWRGWVGGRGGIGAVEIDGPGDTVPEEVLVLLVSGPGPKDEQWS